MDVKGSSWSHKSSKEALDSFLVPQRIFQFTVLKITIFNNLKILLHYKEPFVQLKCSKFVNVNALDDKMPNQVINTASISLHFQA